MARIKEMLSGQCRVLFETVVLERLPMIGPVSNPSDTEKKLTNRPVVLLTGLFTDQCHHHARNPTF
jgi:hypothetical protein